MEWVEVKAVVGVLAAEEDRPEDKVRHKVPSWFAADHHF